MTARHRLFIACLGIVLVATGEALAQDAFERPGGALPGYARRLSIDRNGPPAARLGGSGRPIIMLTGYWPPTNEMLRRWSDDAVQNPLGWIGSDWEGRGYDIHAYFPEFPNGVGRGEGDFEVDYQDTSGDWWPLVGQLQPIAIVTFSRANTSIGWELEGGNRTYAASLWSADYLAPLRPTPELPIMQQEPPNTERYSTLPIAEILAAVTASGAAVDPFSTVIDDGRFLSNFIGYHGCWYHVLHAAADDPARNIAAGHIHVGQSTQLAAAVTATEATLRALTEYLDKRLIPGDMNCDGARDGADVQLFVLALTDAAGYAAAAPACAIKNGDFNGDEVVTGADVGLFATALLGPS